MNTRLRTRFVALFASLVVLSAAGLTACGGDDGDDGATDYCTAARTFSDGFDEFENAFEQDPESMRRAMTNVRQLVADFGRSAPAEIRDDMNWVTAAFNTVIDTLDRFDYDFMALAGDPEAIERLGALDSPEFAAAADRVDEFTERTCGFRIES